MRFFVYDVETANSNVGSICAVGWAYTDGLDVIENGYSLINPNTHFSPYNTQVHGLTEEDVQNSPTFDQYWVSTLEPYMRNTVVVSYGAEFDIDATEQALRFAGIVDPGIEYIDALPVFKKYLPDLQNHRLSTCAEWAKYDYKHHHAGEDALAIVAVAKALCNALGYQGFEDLIIRGISTKNSLTNKFEPSNEPEQKMPHWARDKRQRCEPVERIDNILLDCKICITGDVPGMDREQVKAKVEQHGGKLMSNVSGKTHFLVVGTYADYPDDYVSGKHKAALELIEQGSDIGILNACQFFDLLNNPKSNERFCRYAEEIEAKKREEEEKLIELRRKEEQRAAKAEQKKASSSKPKRVIQKYSLDGILLKEYMRISDASTDTGVNAKSIRDAANGVQKTAGGFVWKFETEEGQE